MANITRAGVASLIPDQYVRGIIQEARQQSTLMQLCRTVPMARGAAKQPVLTTLPTGAWVSPRDTGRKTTSAVEWQDVTLTAEELAVIVPIPEAVLDDSDYDIWGEVTPLVGQEFGRLLDLAGLFGTGPASFGTSVVELARGATPTPRKVERATDLVAELNSAMGMVEEQGFVPNGWAAPITQRASLRGLKDTTGQPIFVPSFAQGEPPTLFGEPIVYSRNGGWDSAATTGALFIVGDWSKAIVGVRQDVTMKVLDQATITDGAGNVTISLAEQDMVALRCVFRVAFATANPVTPLATTAAARSPFAVVVNDV